MKRLASWLIAVGSITALAGCSVPGVASSSSGILNSGSGLSATDVHTVIDLAKFIGTKTKSDVTSHFTVSVGAAHPKPYEKPATGEGFSRVTDQAADISFSLNQDTIGLAKIAVIGSDAFFVSNSPNAGGSKVDHQTVQSIADSSTVTLLAPFIFDSMWVSHPEVLDGAFTLIGSSPDKIQDGQAVTRFRLTADTAKAADLIDLHLGFAATDHSALASVTVTLDYRVNTDGQVIGFTAAFKGLSKDESQGAIVFDYKFTDFGKAVDIVKPT